MGWTNWRKIAEKGTWCDDELDYDGPACYELAVGGPRGGDIRPVYVGETVNERTRVIACPRPRSIGMIPKAPVLDIFIGRDRDAWRLYVAARSWRPGLLRDRVDGRGTIFPVARPDVIASTT